MENNVEKAVKDILADIGRNINIENIAIGSEVEVKIGAIEGGYYFLKVRAKKLVPNKPPESIPLYSNDNVGVDGMFPFNVANGISKGLVLEEYKAPVNIKYMKNKDKIRLGIPVI